MNPTVRLLPYAVAGGPHNMAADEALLATAVVGAASLRFYGWSEPTLSLGYFQPERLRLTEPLLAALPFVRRPSGGDTLVHHHELTYALALPAGRQWQSPDPCLRCIHRVLAAALARLGVRTRLSTPAEGPPFAGVLCFQHHTAGDLLLDGHKVAGSAQRKQRGALLQHGAVLLAQSPHTPALPGVRELRGLSIEPAELAAVVVEEFERETGWRVEASAWTEVERQRTESLRASRYTQDAWNRKR
jgi:lipoate-protein ligase A